MLNDRWGRTSMRRLTLVLMMMMLMVIGSTVEARSMLSPSVELEPMYGLPFNRAPYYRRGPRPPAVREHDKYRRAGQQKVRIPFERDRYLILPRRKPPRRE